MGIVGCAASHTEAHQICLCHCVVVKVFGPAVTCVMSYLLCYVLVWLWLFVWFRFHDAEKEMEIDGSGGMYKEE